VTQYVEQMGITLSRNHKVTADFYLQSQSPAA